MPLGKTDRILSQGLGHRTLHMLLGEKGLGTPGGRIIRERIGP